MLVIVSSANAVVVVTENNIHIATANAKIFVTFFIMLPPYFSFLSTSILQFMYMLPTAFLNEINRIYIF